MNPEERANKQKVKDDKEFVHKILNGDVQAWSEFVDRFTDWVFYRAKEFCRKEGAFVQKHGEMKSKESDKTYIYTEEELEVYIWIMDQLKRKIKAYTGKRGAGLSTYIWAVLNSRYFFVDFLRWKYGDPRKLPKVMKDASKKEKKVFELLRIRKSIVQIASDTGLSIEEVERVSKQVIEKLSSSGLEYMVLPAEIIELNEELISSLPKSTSFGVEDTVLLREVYTRFCEAGGQLRQEEQVLLRLFYNLGLKAGEILENYQEAKMDLPGGISPLKLDVKDIRNILTKIREKFLVSFREMCKHLEGVTINNNTVMTFLKEIGICTES